MTIKKVLDDDSYWGIVEDDCIYLRFNNFWGVIEVFEFASAPSIKGKSLVGDIAIDDYDVYFYEFKDGELYLDISDPGYEGYKYKKATYLFDDGKDLLTIQCDGHDLFDEPLLLRNTHCTSIDGRKVEYLD